jgi:hypothetical protein
MSKQLKEKTKYDIYENKEDAFLSGYSEATDDVIQTLLDFMAFDTEGFLFFVIKDFIRRNKEHENKTKN